MIEPVLRVQIEHEFPGSQFHLRAAFECHDGWTVLFGPSGAGKSSLLRAIAGLLRPQQGRIQCGAAVWSDSATATFLPSPQRNVGYVAQNPALFPHLTVAENVAFSRPYTAAPIEVAALLQMFHCTHLSNRRPQDLSGGEQQRVAMARALARNPQLLLLDEPFRALDAELRAAILADLKQYLARNPMPVLFVTHDPIEALSVNACVFRINNGEITESGPVREMLAAERNSLLRVLAP